MTKHLYPILTGFVIGTSLVLTNAAQAGFIEAFYHEAGLPQGNLTAAAGRQFHAPETLRRLRWHRSIHGGV